MRNFARVITTDEFQGIAAARFAAKDLGVKKCAMLNDADTYGEGVAKAFAAEAVDQGITVLEHKAWDARQPNYAALFTSIKAQHPDCVYLGGVFGNNGGQLVRDKVGVLGDNNAVKLIGPDGFVGYPDLDRLPQADGMYLTFPGLDLSQIAQGGGAGAKLLSAYRAKYGSDPPASYVIYGVQALQVILAAIPKSDGTRRGVRDAVFEGDGIRIPASDAVLAKDIKIDPRTGDVNTVDVTILRIESQKETFVKPYPII
jgi:branched-chain amino acid transport system substrate-binding protein